MRSSTRRVLLVLFACAALGAVAATLWQSTPALPPGGLAGHNVLLITIDTLRADRIGAYGASIPTPTLDALAAEGVRFARAYSPAPMTLPAHTSILTGLTPPSHGVRNNGAFRLDASIPTLATILAAQGYRTGAFVGAFVLDSRFGLARGFDEYDDRYGGATPFDLGYAERNAPGVLEPAVRWIVEQPANARWFAWVHLFDPHAPYAAPAAFARDGPHGDYDAEVAYVDRELGRSLQQLRQAGALDRTLVVVTADHGESLGEHGETTHGLFAYDATLRVPLIMSAPALHPSTVDTRVGLVDIAPTILELVGAPSGRFDGRSLRTALAGAELDEFPVYFEALDANLTRNWAPLTGVIADGLKAIDLPLAELYDLERDPGERRDLSAVRAPDFRRLLTILAHARHDGADGRPQGAAMTALDAEAMTRLHALGYAGAPSAAAGRPPGANDDPKRLVELNERFTRALRLATEGRTDDALRMLDSVIAERPDFTVAWTTAARVCLESGRAADAVTLLSGPSAPPASIPDVARLLGAAWMALGRLSDVVKVLEPLSSAPGLAADARTTLAVAYTELGRTDEARGLYEAVLAEAPHAAATWNNLGVLHLRRGEVEHAASAFRQATTYDPRLVDAWLGLGAATSESRPAEAIDAWRHAVVLAPSEFDALYNLAMLTALHTPADASSWLEQFIARAPTGRYAAEIAAARRQLDALWMPKGRR